MIPKWLPFLAKMTYADYLKGTNRVAQPGLDLEAKIDLNPFLQKVSEDKRFFLSQGASPALKEQGIRTIRYDAKRVRDVKKISKYDAEEKALIQLVIEAIEVGRPLSTHDLERKIRAQAETDSSFSEEWKNIYYPIEKIRTLDNWIRRVLQRSGYSIRRTTVSQSVPDDWEQVARRFKQEYEAMHAKFDPHYVIAADETFLLFNEHDQSKFVVRKGSRSVNRGFKSGDNKAGCTLMVSVEQKTGVVLKPFIIMKAKHGGKLMTDYKNHSKSTVVFNDSHWMAQEQFKIYLRSLVESFPKNSRILLVVDKHSSHTGELTKRYVDEVLNANGELLKLFFIPAGMTPILQVGDVGINRDLKLQIAKGYREIMDENKDKIMPKLSVGETVEMTLKRGRFIQLVEDSMERLNDEPDEMWVQSIFRKCGQGEPRFKTIGDKAFEEHIESLKNKTLETGITVHSIDALEETEKKD